MSYRLAILICRFLAKVLFHFQVAGAENINKVKGAIYAVNHASYLDPVFASIALDRKVYFLARKTLFRNRFFGKYLTSLQAVPFNRETADTATLKKIISLLKNGQVVLIFPEGTRSLDGNLRAPHIGISYIAIKAGVPIVPAYIKGSFKILPKHAKTLKMAKAGINIGEPIYLDKWLSKKNNERSDYEEIAGLVMQKIRELC